MNSIKIKTKVNPKALTKIVFGAYILAAAAVGTIHMYHESVRKIDTALDSFSQQRALAKDLVQPTVVQVPVIDAKAASEIVAGAAQAGASKGAKEAVDKAVTGK